MKTILLADDEANLRTLVRTTLEDPLHKILEAPDGSVALEMTRKERPDLLVLDWMMPGLTGIEVLRALRASEDLAHIPVLMLTAKGQDKDRDLALTLGVQGFLVKPFSPMELLDKVQEILMAAAPRSPGRIAPASAPRKFSSDLSGKLERTDSQLAYYARDLKRAIEAERERAKELAKANADLQILNRLKTEFVIFISRELRNPLNAMSIVHLLDPYGDSNEQSEAIDVVRHGYERLHDFIQKGLRYFEWLATERVASSESSDLPAVVHAVAHNIPALREPGVDFRVDAPNVPSFVRAAEGPLREVLEALLDNAVRHSPEEKHIRVNIAVVEDFVVLTVADRGIGIDHERVRDLFHPFTVSDVTRRPGGTGLSLALAQAIVTAHGGRLGARSAGRGKGATFTVELPLARELVPLGVG